MLLIYCLKPSFQDPEAFALSQPFTVRNSKLAVWWKVFCFVSFLVPDERLWPLLCIAGELENITQNEMGGKKAQGLWNKSWWEGKYSLTFCRGKSVQGRDMTTSLEVTWKHLVRRNETACGHGQDSEAVQFQAIWEPIHSSWHCYFWRYYFRPLKCDFAVLKLLRYIAACIVGG